MKSKLVNYEQLEEMFKKHDVDNKMSSTISSQVFEKLFVVVTTILIVLVGISLFIIKFPFFIVEALLIGIYRGIKNAKKISD